MLSVEFKKSSFDSFYKKMDKIISGLPEATNKGVNLALNNVKDTAIRNKRGTKDDKMFVVEILDFESGKITGQVKTNKDIFSYASFLEFGTGTYAQLPHIGTTKTFIDSNYAYWLLPKEKASRPLNNPLVYSEKTGTYFYVMFATRPYPFMRPTAQMTRKESVGYINMQISKLFREVAK